MRFKMTISLNIFRFFKIFFPVAPLRLMAMKNGERDARLAMPVVGPNLTNVRNQMRQWQICLISISYIKEKRIILNDDSIKSTGL